MTTTEVRRIPTPGPVRRRAAGALLALVAATAQAGAVAAQRPEDRAHTTRLMRHAPVLIGALLELASAEALFRTTHGRYSPTLHGLEPPLVLPGGVNLAVVTADTAGWRAVGIHDSVPGLGCQTTGGRPAPLPQDTIPGRVQCAAPWLGALLVGVGPDGVPLLPREYTEATVERKPRATGGCFNWRLTQDMAARVQGRQRVLLEFVLDAQGKPELPGLTVLASNDADYTQVALELLEKCRFRAGSVGGNPVRVLVNMPFDLVGR